MRGPNPRGSCQRLGDWTGAQSPTSVMTPPRSERTSATSPTPRRRPPALAPSAGVRRRSWTRSTEPRHAPGTQQPSLDSEIPGPRPSLGLPALSARATLPSARCAWSGGAVIKARYDQRRGGFRRSGSTARTAPPSAATKRVVVVVLLARAPARRRSRDVPSRDQENKESLRAGRRGRAPPSHRGRPAQCAARAPGRAPLPALPLKRGEWTRGGRERERAHAMSEDGWGWLGLGQWGGDCGEGVAWGGVGGGL